MHCGICIRGTPTFITPTFIISDPLIKFRKLKFLNFGREKGVPPFQQDFHQDFRFFHENPSFGILTILKIGKDLILRKKC